MLKGKIDVVSGFLPSQTAKHHQANVLAVLRQALDEASVKPEDIDAIAYTKGITKYCVIAS